MPLFFFFVAFVAFIIAWYEERLPSNSDSDEKSKDYMVITFFILSAVFFFFSGVSFLYVTGSQYSVTTDTYTTIFYKEYWPFAIGISSLGILSIIIAVSKGFDVIGE